MTTHKLNSDVHGPANGDPALRSVPPPDGSRRPISGGGRRPPILMLGCLSSYDYLCHDYACRLWANCPHGGNRD